MKQPPERHQGIHLTCFRRAGSRIGSSMLPWAGDGRDIPWWALRQRLKMNRAEEVSYYCLASRGDPAWRIEERVRGRIAKRLDCAPLRNTTRNRPHDAA